jgi:motility quorum-sensing regulator/GCU-specific mRNA interferase toxin
MEKRTPHCRLSKIKALVTTGKVRSTVSALNGAAALGMDYHAMIATVMALESKDFYKSMTSYGDHHLWQDVYCPQTEQGEIYLKLTVVDDVLIVSFKER